MIWKNSLALNSLTMAVAVGLGPVSSLHAQTMPAPAVAPTQPAPTQPVAADPLAAANLQVQQAQAALDAANSRAESISSHLDADRQQGKIIRERLSRGDEALPEIQAKIASASARLSARKQEMGVADVDHAPMKFAADKARLNAIGEFEKSPEYRAALQSVTDAAAALQTVQADSLRRLAATDAYQQAQASAQTPDGQAKLEALKAQRLAADPNVAIAQSRVQSAKASLDALRSKFMEQDPKVADADGLVAHEQSAYDKLAAAAAAAERDLADGQAMLDRQHAGLDADRAALTQLTAEITQLQNDLAAAQTAVAQATDDLNRASGMAANAQQAHDSAIAIQAQPQPQPQIIYSSPSYQYAPPPVVYQQPVYAPAYYGGYYGGYAGVGIVVGPSRGYGYGYGAYRGTVGHDFHGGQQSHGSHGGGGHR